MAGIRHYFYRITTAPVLCPAVLALVVAGLALYCWPVEVFCVSRQQGNWLRSPVRVGARLETRMVHSVQLTPVEDRWQIIQGQFWLWQERVQSHNAGLPFAAPRQGKFYAAPPWFVVEGGRYATPNLMYRVGTKDLGKNELRWGSSPWLPLYSLAPGERLEFFLSRAPVYTLLPQTKSPF